MSVRRRLLIAATVAGVLAATVVLVVLIASVHPLLLVPVAIVAVFPFAEAASQNAGPWGGAYGPYGPAGQPDPHGRGAGGRHGASRGDLVTMARSGRSDPRWLDPQRPDRW